MQDEALTTEVAANGHRDLSADVPIIKALEAQVNALEARREELQVELDAVTPELRRYEKAIKALRGQPLGNPSTSREVAEDGEEDQPRRRGPGRPKASGVSADKLERIEATVRQLAADKDDFTQVEVRTITGEGSGTTALAFEALRQKNIIRLVRREGNLKVFRLTREALSKAPAEGDRS